jgi:hypothetical protein
MARDGLSPLARAVFAAALFALCGPAAAQNDDRQNSIATTLAVQTALQQGREHLLRGNSQAAVYVLEGQLSRINGSREYLGSLRDAYRAYIKELRVAGKDADAEEYLKRLRILDPGAGMDGSLGHAPGRTAPAPAAAPPAPAPSEAARVTPMARGKSDDDPFRPDNQEHRPVAGPLEQARHEFAARHYEEAARLYQQVNHAGTPLSSECKEEWAYCKFHQVARQLNDSSRGGASCADLEREVRVALSMAPRLDDQGKRLLRAIQERQGARQAGDTGATAAVAVRHLEQPVSGWAVAETANFRVLHHNQPRDVVERAAQVAEQTRAAMQRKWLGKAGPDWSSRCDLYLHTSAREYSQATGVAATNPGFSTIHIEGGRVIGRRLDMHCDEPDMLTAILPHETTHVVLAEKFADLPLPRWADEGIAVLTEPREKIERHLHSLPQFRQDGQLFSARQLLQMSDYPEARLVRPFYAESVSLVDYLSRESPQTFAQFVRDGQRDGYEAALKRYYGINDFDELERRWQRYAFGDATAAAGVAGR